MNHPILGQTALAYSPVIDRNRTVIATRLTVMPLTQGAALDASALLAALADTWPEGGQHLWLNVASESLLQDLLQAEVPAHIFIEVPAFMALDPVNSPALLALHDRGNTLLLKGRPLQELPREVLPCFKYSIIDYNDDRRIQQGNPNQPSTAPEGTVRNISHVQAGITSIEEMELSFRKGALAVLGWPIDNVIDQSSKPADQPALQVIVQLIDQLHRGEDIDDLENTLKRDPPLAFKLMRYINSPAFGLSVEISSFRHAIMILGYQRLKRWLALLLATASKDPNMRPVMFAAVRRGLLMEELAKISGDDEMRNELFICGVFSLLDRMFRQPFSELLKTIPVPERVFQALADQSGPYEPYFELVQAIEAGIIYDIKDVADKLLLTFPDLNGAILKAMYNAAQLD
ncbi:MAG: HDOD domain-containing protein [Aquabacterium sp.]|jgi:EAL and modified HD-GYP domain-containing signal transduction protein|uniref:EAL and HDOD domain-containing protein n=1 Tax=Aquabacterium sp. TaxID=1872578 RepID=UPI002A365434|nr:HDOD domain-containing protein [Aquabacterium sp.]MDX9844754.1 HDOD domain-containing protein [Aquabacterium sp.]